ncbi:hypothetical protein BUALT_Bualt16G0019200 [Buddleja alternifolia]|uniref:Protein kinase domain-containing protein n=1 Tax=Buddleja alternifolia TaxID=168488 RepID=A0AAV6WIY4_9LAMI|nr:hypothetical protein BUALT_Bualt16G0019200 [Buddleja alternifolia]
MGCISSKKARSESPPFDVVVPSKKSSSSRNAATRRNESGRARSSSSSLLHAQAAFGPLEKIKEEPENEEGSDDDEDEDEDEDEERNDFVGRSGNLKGLKKGSSNRKSVFSFKFGRLTEGEHVAAGWPAWLSAVAGEVIDGWLPLRSDTFQRLEKIGQGTYSDVYRARDVETGKMVAVKKVRFDNFQPESVKFMAREILILRKLDHPNIMKLEGIITSRLSCSIYLVFEYMEHDLAGLLSCPDIKFTDSQLLCGIKHCHSRGILHRDIKTSNILVNNEGILKIADFGLANFSRPKNKPSLTSRVVTLWYRPPELLLGSTNYGEAVDLWSVGCVFAELFIGRPLLKGRTEVEQLHKIFKLCGSPPDEYWKRSKLPLANMFKPQHPYESTLRERCKEFPKSAVSLIETFLSFEPYKRGTASSALDCKYFITKPYACDPSSLPKYPPNKEIDAKFREDARRKKAGATARAQSGSRNPRREAGPNHVANRKHGGSANIVYKRRGAIGSRTSLKQSYDTLSEASQMTEESQESTTRSVPMQVSTSSGFEWDKRQKQHEMFSRSKKPGALDQPNVSRRHYTLDSDGDANDDFLGRVRGNEASKRAMRGERVHLHRPDSFDSDVYEPHELSMDIGNKKKKGKVAFSGPMIYPSQEVPSRQHDQPRQVINRSRFYKDL